MKKTTTFALGLSLMKVVFPRISLLMKRPINLLRMVWSKLDYELIGFFVTVNVIFKVSLEGI